MADESIWHAGECAAYLKASRKHFLRELRFKEGFPKPLPWSEGGHPKWSAQQVKDWALVRPPYAQAA